MAKARIVVVEDEIIVARDVERTLVRLGYDVPGMAATGQDALELVSSLRPDLVLMDIQLAGDMDGIAAAEQIRLRYALPVVFLTAHSDEATFHRAQITEPYSYVLKPFEERELDIAVGVALYRHRAETRLAQMERWLAATLRSIGDAVIATDLAGSVTFMNQRAEALTGWTLAEAHGVQLDDVLRLVQAADHAPVANLVERVLREDIVIELGPDTLLMARNGNVVPVDNSATPIRDSAGGVSGFVIVFRDVTARKLTEDQLRYSAVHDPLTGLANRVLLMERLERAFDRSRRHTDYPFALLYLDLDDFKSINDRLGHTLGDQALIGVARRLEGSLRGDDTVARLGGDEFVILLDSIGDVRDAAHVAARIQRNLAAPMHLEGHEVLMGASLGIALNGPADQQPADLLREADQALYRAKGLGKGRQILADARQNQDVVKLLALETELRRAAQVGEFCLHYQPILQLSADEGAAAGQVRGLEALLRWRHPQRGLLLPADFLGLMEETGLLVTVGQWVLQQACRQAKAWQARSPGAAGLGVSVNLSNSQFLQRDLVEQVAQALAESDLEPGRLCLDVPAGAVLDHEAALDTLRRLRGLGVQLHLDGFGQGLIGLSMLQRAALDALKISAGALQSLNDVRSLARTLLALALALGLPVVAVGVETAEQAEALRALGCEWGQGFALGRPCEAAEIRL